MTVDFNVGVVPPKWPRVDLSSEVSIKIELNQSLFLCVDVVLERPISSPVPPVSTKSDLKKKKI